MRNIRKQHEDCNCYFCCLADGYEKFMDVKKEEKISN